MEESRKLSGKDLITIGIFSAIYFMLNLAAMFTGFVPVLWLLLPEAQAVQLAAWWGLFCRAWRHAEKPVRHRTAVRTTPYLWDLLR